ncbi:PadR family transcriptional regulator [Nocardioides marmoribigeumensis]|uniref:DNA-binding PadR family transcriptional regulator n=1 Tax=Nocardioides marmoribigeumensis TaxID=433649 RepID=A0ABU2BW35_9ACTN|nr:PadR family transcriptional regulator [Nocardioides marmoribigeumensis]MDR7362847.1 DNA-binding PadR family transcriptional regulator [Nocardioides marmoribigeumensis]
MPNKHWQGGRGGGWSEWSDWGHQQAWRSSGPPPWLTGLFGLAQAGQSAKGAPKVRRGDVRSAILDVLSGEPMNGYQVIQQIAERSNGLWKPSPGSVYPTIQQLEDEGLVEGTSPEGRRLLQLTAAGRVYVEERAEELAETWRPFDEAQQPTSGGEAGDLKPVIGQVMGAVWQVITTGTRQQQAEAAEILSETRRRLYTLLADGEPS